jgi:hypothetical protein
LQVALPAKHPESARLRLSADRKPEIERCVDVPKAHTECTQDGPAKVLQPNLHQKGLKYDMEFYHIDVLRCVENEMTAAIVALIINPAILRMNPRLV